MVINKTGLIQIILLTLAFYAGNVAAQPSPNPTITLGFDGQLRDRVGERELGLTPDGKLDGVFTVTLNPGSGNRTVTRLHLTNSPGGIWNTQSPDGFWSLGVANGLDTGLLNGANDSVNFPITEGASFKIFAADLQNRMFVSGTVFTLAATFADGSTSTAAVTISNATITLAFDGQVRDRVGQGEAALTLDGKLDGVFTMTLNPASGNRTVTLLRLSNSIGGVWDTQSSDGFWSLGVANGLDAGLLNAANDSVNFSMTEGTSLKIFASDSQNRMFLPGTAFTLAATFADGSTATANVTTGAGPDPVPPATTIISGPTGTDVLTDALFSWTGSDNVTPVSNLVYAYRLNPIETSFSAFGNATTAQYSNLTNGFYSFYVKAKDQAGNEDPAPAAWAFNVSAGGAAGKTYYVFVNGNDNNPGTLGQPFKTLQKAISLLKPGDTLLVRGGEYDTVNGLINAGNSIIPSGLSWDQPVTIKAFPGETPVFRRYLPPGYDETVERTKIYMPTQAQCNAMGWTQNYPWGCWSGGSWNSNQGDIRIDGAFVNGYVLMLPNSLSKPVQYVIFDGIVFDAAGITLGAITLGEGAIHLKFQNFEIKNSIQSCLTQPSTDQSASKDLWFVNGKVHHCGAPYWVAGTAGAHGTFDRTNPAHRFHQSFYMHSGGVVWDGVEVSDVGGAGVSPLGPNNIIRNSYFHNNTAMGLICAGNWLLENNVIVTSGTSEGAKTYGCRFRNNTLMGTNTAKYGIFIDQNAPGPDTIENNIIVGYDYGVISNQTGGQSPIVRNNVIVSNNPGREIYESSSSVIAITRQNNHLGQDPKFVNPAAGDFRLQPNSPAIGKATNGGNIGAK